MEKNGENHFRYTRQIHLSNGKGSFDEEVYLSIRRSIRELFGKLGEIVLALRESTEIKIKNPQKVINNVEEQTALWHAQGCGSGIPILHPSPSPRAAGD